MNVSSHLMVSSSSWLKKTKQIIIMDFIIGQIQPYRCTTAYAFFEMKPKDKIKWTILSIPLIEMFGPNGQHHVCWKPTYPVQAQQCGWFGVYSQKTWASWSHWQDHEHICISEYSKGKCEAIHQTAKTWSKLSHATMTWNTPANLHLHIYIYTWVYILSSHLFD